MHPQFLRILHLSILSVATVSAAAPALAAASSPGWSVSRIVDREIAEATRRHGSTAFRLTRKDVTCLAENVYFEARGESDTGMAAVAHVTMNRLADPDFPRTLCQVVREPNQFAWTRAEPHRSGVSTIADKDAFAAAARIAAGSLAGHIDDPTEGATFFHAGCQGARKPVWTRSMVVTAVIGCHVFLTGGRNIQPPREVVEMARQEIGVHNRRPDISLAHEPVDPSEPREDPAMASVDDDDSEIVIGMASIDTEPALILAEERIPAWVSDDRPRRLEPIVVSAMSKAASPLQFGATGFAIMLWLSIGFAARDPRRDPHLSAA